MLFPRGLLLAHLVLHLVSLVVESSLVLLLAQMLVEFPIRTVVFVLTIVVLLLFPTEVTEEEVRNELDNEVYGDRRESDAYSEQPL